MKKEDRRLRELMRSQFGVIALDQATRLAVTPGQVRYRVATGEWEPVHRGVYRSTSAPRGPRQELLAACLAAGPLAAASHQSAAWVWGLLASPPTRPALTVPRSVHPVLRGVTIHRIGDFDPLRTVVHRGIPCTDALRTAGDLASVLPRDQLTKVVDAALFEKLVSTSGLVKEIGRRRGRGRRGPAELQRVLDERGLTGGPEPSVLESEAMRLWRRAGIPVLAREVRMGLHGQYRIDFLIAPGLVVEVDGFAYHWSPEAKSRDEARRNELRLGGAFVLVYTWRDIRFEPRRVVREVAGALLRHAG